MEAGTLTLPRRQQTMDALAKANRRRKGHMGLKRDLAAGRVRAADALTDPRAAGSFTVGTLLTAQRGWGRKSAATFLANIGASDAVMMKRVETLTERQITVLVDGLADPFPSTPKDGLW